MGLSKLVTSFIMIFLFTLAVVSFMVGFGNDNTVYTDLGNDTEISVLKTSIEGNLTGFSGNANSSSQAFQNSTIAVGGETLESGSVFKILTPSFASGMKGIFRTINQKIFGNDSSFAIVLTTFSALIVIALVLGIWKAWKGGNPD